MLVKICFDQFAKTYSKEQELCKMLVRMVLSDRYSITQEKFQYHGV